jgi:hypothetical protein
MQDVDDGVLYLTKEEFFEYFENVYLGASDMTSFLLDGMKMSKHSKHLSQQSKHSKIPQQSTHSASANSLDSFILEEGDEIEDFV